MPNQMTIKEYETLMLSINKQDNLFTVSQDGSGDYNGNTGSTIQSAINAAEAVGGGTIIIKKGTYIITSQIELKSNVNILGSGWDSIIKNTLQSITQSFYGDTVGNFTISNLQFLGRQKDASPNNYTRHIRLDGCFNVTIDKILAMQGYNVVEVNYLSLNVNISNLTAYNHEHCIQIYKSSHVNITNVIHTTQSHTNQDEGSYNGYIQRGITIQYSQYINISNCSFTNFDLVGIYIRVDDVADMQNLHTINISNCIFKDDDSLTISQGFGIQIHHSSGTNNWEIYNVNIDNCSFYNLTGSNIRSTISDSTKVHNINISNISGYGGNGIYLYSLQDVNLSNFNIIEAAQGIFFSNVSNIFGNNLRIHLETSSGYPALAVWSESTNIRLNNIDLSGDTTDINIDATVNDMLIDGGILQNSNATISSNGITIRSVVGYVTENWITATITNGTNTVTISHGLATAPDHITCTSSDNALGELEVVSITSTQATINSVNNASGDQSVYVYVRSKN